MHTVNGKPFKPASVISKGKIYRFDLAPSSLAVVAKQYDFSTGWTFTSPGDQLEVTYTANEIRQRLNSGSIYEQIGG